MMQSDKLQDINLNTPDFKSLKKLVLVAGIFTCFGMLFVFHSFSKRGLQFFRGFFLIKSYGIMQQISN